jgi:hypothetical protein
MSKLKDITGCRFGALVVLHRADRTGVAHWVCRCDCGTVKVVRGQNMTRKKSITRSCGCQQHTSIVKPDHAITRAFGGYKRNARIKNRCFDLTFEQFSDIVAKDCFYCGQPPSMTHSKAVVKRMYSGVDRKDSRVGYTPDNCLPCCTKCNTAKSDYTTEEFLTWVNQIAAHQAATQAA